MIRVAASRVDVRMRLPGGMNLGERHKICLVREPIDGIALERDYIIDVVLRIR